jgi:hypothetical protein
MDREDISVQIGRILRSQSFADKSQLRSLLEILFRNLDAQTTLKPDRVIKELWPDEAKTKGSPDLATEKNRLRKALELYYGGEGKSDPILVTLPNRSMPGPDGAKERRWIVASPRASDQAVLPPPAKVVRSRGMWKMIAGTVAMAIVIYIPIRALSPVTPPQSARLDGETLTIMDGEGKELWHKAFPNGFWSSYYDQGLAPRMWFGDLDGDGRTDVLLLYHPAVNPMSHSTILYCFSDTGREKWHWTPGRELPELAGRPAMLTTVGLAVLIAPPGKPRRIVVSSRNELYYPHQIAIVDAWGKSISEYWHSGHLEHLVLGNDEAGREEIIATGISNGYHQATMVVLDPDRVFGASVEAARPEIQIHGMGAAQERLRLLFPRSDLNQALAVYNSGGEVTVDQGLVRMPALECNLLPRCYIWYEFGKDFQLDSAMADDQFRSAHKEFYLKRDNDHPFSAEEEREFFKVRCLAGCTTDFLPVQGH